MPEWILCVFAYIGAVAVSSAIIGGLTLAIARAVRWKRVKDEQIDKLFTRTGSIYRRLDDFESREHAVWNAIDDINKRLRDAEKEA